MRAQNSRIVPIVIRTNVFGGYKMKDEPTKEGRLSKLVTAIVTFLLTVLLLASQNTCAKSTSEDGDGEVLDSSAGDFVHKYSLHASESTYITAAIKALPLTYATSVR